jgi:hypothetical protein
MTIQQDEFFKLKSCSYHTRVVATN